MNTKKEKIEIINNAEFITSVARMDQFIEESHPEVAFAGRSNVGKSTLMNQILNRTNLVKTSSKPGCTKCINYFLIDTKIGGFYFVDLPGYGYANISETERKKWASLIENYMENRNTLHLVVIIVDIRRGLEEEEEMLLEYMDYCQRPVLLVASKIDTVSKNERKKLLNDFDEVIPFSGVTGEGTKEVWNGILKYTYPGHKI